MEDQTAIDAYLVKEQAEEGTATERTLRWLADGATSLGEVIERLRQYADYLAELKLLGWELTCEVDNLYMFLRNPAHPMGSPELEDECS